MIEHLSRRLGESAVVGRERPAKTGHLSGLPLRSMCIAPVRMREMCEWPLQFWWLGSHPLDGPVHHGSSWIEPPRLSFTLHLVSSFMMSRASGSEPCDAQQAGRLTTHTVVVPLPRLLRKGCAEAQPALRSGDIDARDVKAQEAAEGCAEYERPQEYRQYR